MVTSPTLPEAEEIRGGLLDFILDLHKKFPDGSLGRMKNGWISPWGDWGRCQELHALTDFLSQFLPHAYDWDFRTWFNVMYRGGEFTRHNHFESQWVAIYHVEGGGDLVIHDGKKNIRVETKPGRIAILHGLVQHSVPKVTTRRRISVSINANFVFSIGGVRKE